MRVPRVCRSVLCSFIIMSLLTCAVTSSFHIGSFSQLSRLRRSLPGSLITAPEGAVGYYHPPPGPVAHRPQPQPQPQSIETLGVPRKTTTETATTTVREFMHELRQAPAVSGNTTATRPNHNTATVTATATVTERVMAANATAMADRGRSLSTAGLFISIFLSVLHL